jgi:predicted AAA+ superfamily ATPase
MKNPFHDLIWNKTTDSLGQVISSENIWEFIFKGFYPELYSGMSHNIQLWKSSYISTYFERDVRALKQIGNLTAFQNFLSLLAARNGQIINYSDLANSIGVAVNTIKSWISILEASFQIIILRPYYNNLGKRLIKMPKIYFTDPGLVCYLTGIETANHAMKGPLNGVLFENLVIIEIYKSILHSGQRPELYYWRTSDGKEVDLLVKDKGRLIPIEIKTTATPNPVVAKNLSTFINLLSDSIGTGYVVYLGSKK